jgi:hypothetical protein
VHAWAFHWLHEISIPKRVRHRLEPEWEMWRTGWGGSTGCIMHWVHTSIVCFSFLFWTQYKQKGVVIQYDFKKFVHMGWAIQKGQPKTKKINYAHF